MTRLAPTLSTVKRLFALSGNECAFRGCKQKLVDESKVLIGEICHIEAAEYGGARFNPRQTDEDRRSYENLILLCANHHYVVDGNEAYDVDTLRGMKREHEGRLLPRISEPDEEIAYRLIERVVSRDRTRRADIAVFRLLRAFFYGIKIAVLEGDLVRFQVKPDDHHWLWAGRRVRALVQQADEDHLWRVGPEQLSYELLTEARDPEVQLLLFVVGGVKSPGWEWRRSESHVESLLRAVASYDSRLSRPALTVPVVCVDVGHWGGPYFPFSADEIKQIQDRLDKEDDRGLRLDLSIQERFRKSWKEEKQRLGEPSYS